jgi:hypothetical protein
MHDRLVSMSAWREKAEPPLYNLPNIAQTVNLDHIRRHYYESHTTINPTGVVPLGPIIDFALPANGNRWPVNANDRPRRAIDPHSLPTIMTLRTSGGRGAAMQAWRR